MTIYSSGINNIFFFTSSNRYILVIDAIYYRRPKNIIDDRASSITIKSKELTDLKFSLIDAIESLNLVTSRSEIKRLIKSNSVKVNDKKYNLNDFSLSNFADKKEINKRLKKRPNYNLKMFKKLKKLQLSLEVKKKESNFIIKNNFRSSSIKKSVRILKRKILKK